MVNPTAPATDCGDRFCVVGAGPNGLIAARAFRHAGLEVDVVERHTAIGGLWNIDNPQSPVYETCNFISDRDRSGFIGYPMPSSLPMFPTWYQVRDFVRSFAHDYGLEPLVQLGTEVVRAAPVTTANGQRWEVELSTGEKRVYRGVVWACGAQRTPYMPLIDGLNDFEGEVIHSRDYKTMSRLIGKRVLVIGAGNSGVDIACDAAAAGEAAYLSVRRGYWFFPKMLFGQPVSKFLTATASVPEGVRDPSTMTPEQLMAFVLASVGDVTDFGLPQPDHEVGATHYIMNDQIMYQIAHGHLQPMADVRRVHGKSVEFVDGRKIDVDTIICATGYTVDIPWLDHDLLDWQATEPDFHLGTFSRKVEGLYAVGVIHFAGPTYLIWDQLAQLAAADARRLITGERAVELEELRNHYAPQLKSGNLVTTHRNILQFDVAAIFAMLDEIRERFGIDIPYSPQDDFYSAMLGEARPAEVVADERTEVLR